MRRYDLLIIGSGTAGLSAAKLAAKHTENFAIIEAGPGGTVCASAGCMPSKTLVAAANAFHRRNSFAEFGICGADNVAVDIPQVLGRVRKLRDGFVEHVIDGAKKYKIIRGEATFKDVNVIMVDGKEYAADAIIICTGSRPNIPKAFEGIKGDVLTTDNLFEKKNLPGKIAVVGMGSVGAELGQALARLGIDVDAIHSRDNVAGVNDPAIASAAQKILGEEMTLWLNRRVDKAEKHGDIFRLYAGGDVIETQGALVATGRAPALENLGLDKIGVELDEEGMPNFNLLTLQIEDYPIYIAGDANSEYALQHEAADEGRIAACRALNVCDVPERKTPLFITFTDPVIIAVGKSANEIEEPLIGEATFDNQGKAVIEQVNQGVLRLYANKSGTLEGAEAMAPAAEHLAHFLALAIGKKLTVKETLNVPFYHPTLEEGMRTALKNIRSDTRLRCD